MQHFFCLFNADMYNEPCHGPFLEYDNENKRIEIFDNDFDIGHGMLDNNKIILNLDIRK